MERISERTINKITAAITKYNETAERYAAQGEHDELQQRAFDRLTSENLKRVAFLASIEAAQRTSETNEYGVTTNYVLVSPSQFEELDELAY